MRSIVLTTNQIVQNGKNDTLVYEFPNSVDLTGAEVAVSNITMYYSWENINSSPLANNVFTYTWEDATNTQTTYSVTIPNGLYEIADINAYFQYVMIANGHYLVNSSGQYVYYAELIINPTRYAIQVNTFPFPTSLPSGYTNPASVAFPASVFHPVLTFPANFNEIIGYAVNFQTARGLGINSNYSYLSSTAPQVQPNSSVLISLSGISNKYANPSSIIYSVAPNVAIGGLIVEKPPFYNWNRFIGGTYNRIVLQFLGNDLTPITILDPNITIILVIRDQDDIIADMGHTNNLNSQIASRNPMSNTIAGGGLASRSWR